jgi:hypothetical protein
MNQQHESEQFARDVSPYSPAPGRCLAALSFQLGKDAFCGKVIEGWDNLSLGLRAMRTNFQTTRLMRYSFTGDLIDQLKELPYTPYEPVLELVVTPRVGESKETKSPFDVARARVIFSSVRADNRLDADSAIAEFTMMKEAKGEGEAESEPDPGPVYAFMTDYKKGWPWYCVLIVAILSLRVVYEEPVDGSMLYRAFEFRPPGGFASFSIGGQVQFRRTIIGVPPILPTSPTISGSPEG